jgi:C-terminal processing protease CtpA/Prc
VNDKTNEVELFTVLDSLLYQLEDGHVNLIAPLDLSRNWNWYLQSPDNFDEQILERYYLGSDYKIAGGFQYRYLRDSIAYLRYTSFSSSFTEAQIEGIFSFFQDAKGLILDLRNNGGGSLNNTYRLAGRFTNSTVSALITDEKTGPAADDFGNAATLTIAPLGDHPFLKPIVLLTNRRCYSATNSFTAITKSLDQFYHLGDTTGGGGGIPIDFELPNGWRYRFSATRSFLPNGYNIELGLAPDSAFNLDPSRLVQGEDQYIEAALNRLD